MTRLRAQSQKSEGKLDGLDIDKYKDPRKATEHNILVLLSKLSYVDDPSTDIVTEDVIVSLLRYIKHAHEPIPRASRILLRVSRNPLCLEKMVGGVRLPWLVEEALDNDLLTLNNIEDDADKMSDGKRKREDGSSSFKMTNETSGLQHQLHSNLALLADSRFGQHVLLRLLQTGSEEARINCALSLPYLCSSDFVRVRLLQEAGGLHLLCVCLLNYPLPAFHGIVTLANFLNVDMKLSETSFSQLAEEHPVLSGQNDLTFILDNQQTVMAERSVMAASSQVFAAMLEGHFSESKQQTVAIAKTEKLPFELVVSYLHGNDLWLQKLRKQDESKTNGGSSNSISLDIALEVLELSERFIVAGLQLKLQMIIYQHLLTKDNVKVIIEFALQHNMNEMTCQCIRYILGNCELEYEDRVNVGKTLMEEHEASEFVSAVEQVLGEQLEER